MREKRDIIDEFATLLINEVAGTIKQNVSFEKLRNSKKIMLLQSAPVDIVEELITKIYGINDKVELVIIGEEDCRKLQEVNSDKKIKHIEHNNFFSDVDIEYIKNIADEEKADMALFFNNYANSVDFSSVEHVLAFIDEGIPVYSYSYIQKELNYYKDIWGHIYGGIVYKSLVEWFRQFK